MLAQQHDAVRGLRDGIYDAPPADTGTLWN